MGLYEEITKLGCTRWNIIIKGYSGRQPRDHGFMQEKTTKKKELTIGIKPTYMIIRSEIYSTRTRCKICRSIYKHPLNNNCIMNAIVLQISCWLKVLWPTIPSEKSASIHNRHSSSEHSTVWVTDFVTPVLNSYWQ